MKALFVFFIKCFHSLFRDTFQNALPTHESLRQVT